MIRNQKIYKGGAEQKSSFSISRDFSWQIKGIAIVLMIIYHFFCFPEWYVEGISYPSLSAISYPLAHMTVTCVGLFAFLTGWTYALHRDKSFRYSFKKIGMFLVDYWTVYLLFLIVAILISGPVMLRDIPLEMIALKTDVMYFCWYVFFYIIVMVAFPLYIKISEKLKLNTLVKEVIFLAVYYRIIYFIFQFCGSNNVIGGIIIQFPTVVCGYLLCKYHIFDFIYQYIKNKKRIIKIIVGILLVLLSYCVMTFKPQLRNIIFFQWVGVPLSIFGLHLTGIQNVKWFDRLFGFLGIHSMNIWFLHSIFFSDYTKNIFQPIAFAVKNPLFVILWVLFLCSIASIPVEVLQKSIKSVIGKGQKFVTGHMNKR